MVCCCVPFCKSKKGTPKYFGISFHEIPAQDELRRKWLNVISTQGGKRESTWIPSDHSSVCGLHFCPEDFTPNIKVRKLKPGTIPSIFLQYPASNLKRMVSRSFHDIQISNCIAEDLHNSDLECKQFGIKEEVDPLPIAEIKIEPQDVKCESISEAEECDVTHIKHEVQPIAHLAEMEGTNEILQDYDNKSQQLEKNTQEDEINYGMEANRPCENYDTSLKYITYSAPASHQLEDKAQTSSVGNKSCEELFVYCKDLTARMNSGDRLFGCDLCSKSFSQKNSLLAHMRTHTGEKPFKCDDCGKSFSEKANLGRHMRTHTGEKLFTCNICNNSYSHKSHLQAHNRTHTGEKPFICDVCTKSFCQKSNLNAHMRVHVSDKVFRCDVCMKSFSGKRNVVRHMRIHTGEKPYSCNICRKRFSHQSHLIDHKRTHLSEKPFTCSVCNKSFCRKSNRTAHMRTHKGKKPFSCNTCSKSFCGKYSLAKHMCRGIFMSSVISHI